MPFALSIDVHFTFGPEPAEQMLTRALARGRTRPGKRLSADDIAKQYRRTTPSVYGLVLAESDSLMLDQSQIADFRSAEAPYLAKVDSIWRAVGAVLAALPESYDVANAQAETDAASDAVWALAQVESKHIASVLTPLQLSLAPQLVRVLATSRGPLRVRITVW